MTRASCTSSPTHSAKERGGSSLPREVSSWNPPKYAATPPSSPAQNFQPAVITMNHATTSKSHHHSQPALPTPFSSPARRSRVGMSSTSTSLSPASSTTPLSPSAGLVSPTSPTKRPTAAAAAVAARFHHLPSSLAGGLSLVDDDDDDDDENDKGEHSTTSGIGGVKPIGHNSTRSSSDPLSFSFLPSSQQRRRPLSSSSSSTSLDVKSTHKRREYEETIRMRKRVLRNAVLLSTVMLLIVLIYVQRLILGHFQNRWSGTVTDEGDGGVSFLSGHHHQQQQQQRRHKREPGNNSPHSFLGDITMDILSIGSQNRLEYLVVQRGQFVSPFVRQFLNVTELDDFDQTCFDYLSGGTTTSDNNNNNNNSNHNNQTRNADDVNIHNPHLKEMTTFCRKGGGDRKRLRHDLVRRDLAKYFMPQKSAWFQSKHDKVRWLCAQQRPLAGLNNVLATYRYDNDGDDDRDAFGAMNAFELPDYLVILDDDTYLDPEFLKDYLIQYERDNNVTSANPIALSGCQIKISSFSFASGGFGLVLSKGLLRRIQEPLDMKDASHDRPILNHWGERALFRPGMSLLDLFVAHAKKYPYSQYTQWSFPGYCIHSDWVWGYMLQHYGLATMMPLSIPNIDVCDLQGTKCDSSSPICHHATPELMLSLLAARRTAREEHGVLATNASFVYATQKL